MTLFTIDLSLSPMMERCIFSHLMNYLDSIFFSAVINKILNQDITNIKSFDSCKKLELSCETKRLTGYGIGAYYTNLGLYIRSPARSVSKLFI